MKIVLFGDSITDAGRNRAVDFHGSSYGYGYANLIACELLSKNPEKYEIYNRGNSGDRVVDLYARIKSDVWNLEPDVLSILIGVNDVWHEVAAQNGVDLERWDRVYRMIIEDTMKRFPDIKIIICEPFVLDGVAVKENVEKFLEVQMYAKAAKQLAEDYHLAFVPLQDMLHEAAMQHGPAYVLEDGVHPAPGGAKRIADAWLKVFNEIN